MMWSFICFLGKLILAVILIGIAILVVAFVAATARAVVVVFAKEKNGRKDDNDV